MYRIVRKEPLNPSVTRMSIEAPLVAKKVQPGQFIILRVEESGERIPLTVAGYDRDAGTVDIIFQIVGATTEKLNHKQQGESIPDFVGPLGKPTETEGLQRVAVIGGGVGCAIAFPVAKKLFEQGCEVDAVAGFRSKDLVILENEFRANSTNFVPVSDDGSWGEKGLVTDALKKLIDSGREYDVVSMNPIMIDGTGMCGCCRLTVDGKMKFACVDGPDFDGHQVDFDEAMARCAAYKPFEAKAREAACNLFSMEVK